MSPREGVNKHLKLILQIKKLKPNVSHRPVKLVEQTGQIGPRLSNKKPTLKTAGQTGWADRSNRSNAEPAQTKLILPFSSSSTNAT